MLGFVLLAGLLYLMKSWWSIPAAAALGFVMTPLLRAAELIAGAMSLLTPQTLGRMALHAVIYAVIATIVWGVRLFLRRAPTVEGPAAES